jgi:hypothetical protein
MGPERLETYQNVEEFLGNAKVAKKIRGCFDLS